MNTITASDLDGFPRRKVLARLTTVTQALADAQADLEDFLLALHDSGHWDEVTYAELAACMGVSRQAVQQRVLRLLLTAQERRSDRLRVSDPNQLRLGD